MIFIVLKLKSFNLDIKEYMSQDNIIGIATAIALLMFSTFSLSLGWRKILEQLTNRNLPKKEIENIYIKTNLSKYIPGNVMQFVGRNLLAKEYDIPQDTVALSTMYEIGLLGLIGGSIILLSGQLKIIIDIISLKYFLLIIVVVGILGICCLFFKLNDKVNTYLRNVNYRNIGLCIKKVAIYYMTGLILMGLSFVIVLYTFHSGEIKLSNIFIFVGAFIVAWFIGFITPGVPGGIGVREAILMIYLGSLFTSIYIMEIVAIHRAITIFSDIIMYLIYLIRSKGSNKNES